MLKPKTLKKKTKKIFLYLKFVGYCSRAKASKAFQPATETPEKRQDMISISVGVVTNQKKNTQTPEITIDIAKVVFKEFCI